MTERFFYYKRRLQETPVQFLFAKAWLTLKKRLFWPIYFANRYLPAIFVRDREIGAGVTRLSGFGADVRRRLQQLAEPAYVRRATERADRIIVGTFECLGYGPLPIPRGDSWHTDGIHSHSWRRDYFTRIDYVKRQVRCDVKVPWEMSRMQYLVWLADGYACGSARRTEYLNTFTGIVLDWIESNPPGYGVNWACPMEVAIRLCNMTIATAIFADDLSDKDLRFIVASLFQHKKFLKRFPEISDVPGNHYLADLLGLLLAEVVFAGGKNGDKRRAVSRFSVEADRQFEREGAHIERAPIYHRLCLDMLTLAAALVLHDDEKLPDPLVGALDRAIEFCEFVASSKGILPVIGDSDSGHILWFGDDPRSFAGSYAFVRRLLGMPSSVSSDLSVWLYAISGCEPDGPVNDSSPPLEFQGMAPAVRSGFTVLQTPRSKTIMRVGAHGLQGRASHDHDDSLSLWIFCDGNDLLVEEGCHSYTLAMTERARNVGSGAHNLLQFEGRDRYVPAAGSVCLTVRGAPTAQLTACAPLDDGGAAASARLRLNANDLSPDAELRRTVSVFERDGQVEIRVVDEWQAVGAPWLEARWHFPPDITLKRAGGRSVDILRANDDVLGRIDFRSESHLVLSLDHFDCSLRYGEKVVAPAIIVRIESASDKQSITSSFVLRQRVGVGFRRLEEVS